MKSLSETIHNQTSNSNLPSQQVQSLEFTKSLLEAVEKGETLKVVRMEQTVNLDTAIQASSLKKLIQTTDEEVVVSGLITLILRTSAFFNIGKSMSEEQAIETAYLLLDKYPHESFEDFVIMFRNAKTGKYGELYNRLDGQIIFKWMGEYLDEKAEHREKLHRAVKFGSGQENLAEVVQNHIQEKKLLSEPKNNDFRNTVIEALKEAVGWKEHKQKELDYQSFKKSFIEKKILENNVTKNRKKEHNL